MRRASCASLLYPTDYRSSFTSFTVPSLCIPKPLQSLLLPSPILRHFYSRFKEDFLLEEVFHSFPCFDADFFQGASSLADEDAFLGIAFDVNLCADSDDVVILLEVTDGNFCAVGHFLFVVKEDLLAQEFCSKEPFRAVS